MPIWESQQYLLQAIYGIPTSALIDFERFEIPFEGPFDVIVAGPSLATRSGLRRLALLHREDPSASILIAFAGRPDAALREIVQVGADDLVQVPADDATLRAAIKRSLHIVERRVRPAGQPTSTVIVFVG